MLDLHTHKNQLQTHSNDHKKELMNLALKLHELQSFQKKCNIDKQRF